MTDGYMYTHTCNCKPPQKSILDQLIGDVDIERLAYETDIDLYNMLDLKLVQYDCTKSQLERKLIIRDIIIMMTAYYLQMEDGI